MEKIDTLTSLEGRKLLQETFLHLRFKRQLSSIRSLLISWKICVFEKDISRYIDKEISLVHSLGFFSGTALWMEEVVNRFYFSSINSFVYFGAAVLLVIIGIRRFSEGVDDSLVIAGVVFEALMLLVMFVVMLFTPNEDGVYDEDSEDNIRAEIGEIGRDFAAVVIQMEKLNDALAGLTMQQEQLINSMKNTADNVSQAIAPNPQMIETMKQTNESLREFKNTVESLKSAADQLKKNEIEAAVRKELERILVEKINRE